MSDLMGINTLFGMSDIEVESFEEVDGKIILHGVPKQYKCPECGETKLISKGSTYTRTLQDCPIYGKDTELVITAKRINCHNRKVPHEKTKNLCPKFAEIEERSRVTKRLQLQVANEDFAHKTFQEIADTYKMTRPTVTDIFVKKAKALDTRTAYPECSIIGIDETHLGYVGSSKKVRMCATIVDMSEEKTRLLDILPDNRQDTVKAALDRFCNPESIKYVTIDMSKSYFGAVSECLPNATVIVDRFHVEQYLNAAVGEAKKRATEVIKRQLSEMEDGPQKEAELLRFRNRKENHYWFRRKMSFWNIKDVVKAAIENGENVTEKQKNFAESLERQFNQFIRLCNDYPIYSDVVTVHEAFAEVFEVEDRKTAEEMFETAVLLLPDKKDKDNILYPFWDFVKTVRNWRQYIFNYFDAADAVHRSNGPVEQWNHEIKAAHNDGRGYDFNILRWKILFGNGKVVLNDSLEFKPAKPYEQFVEYIKAGEKSFLTAERMAKAVKEKPYRAKKLFGAVKNFKPIKTLQKSLKSSRSFPMVIEYALTCIPYLAEAAKTLDKEYAEHFRYIMTGVTFEELQSQSELIHRQLAAGLEDDDMLVDVDIQNDEENE